MSIILPKLIPAMFNRGIKGSVYVGVIDSFSIVLSHSPRSLDQQSERQTMVKAEFD